MQREDVRKTSRKRKRKRVRPPELLSPGETILPKKKKNNNNSNRNRVNRDPREAIKAISCATEQFYTKWNSFFQKHGIGSMESASSSSTASNPPSLCDNNNDEQEPPPEYLCPIGWEIMTDPVIVKQSGWSYQRQNITQWINEHQGKEPQTQQPCGINDLIINRTLRDVIARWLKEHPKKR